jgi:hypothetical protein
MHLSKVHHVMTINRVASDPGESEDWLSDVANATDIEDGGIWVYGVGEDGVMAFTDFGIESLIDPSSSLRIPTIVTTCSDASRPLVPIDRDQC